jgi:hypothetical protein
MRRNAGVWIDHKKSVIVTISDKGEEIRQINSQVGKRVHYTGGSRAKVQWGPEEVSPEDVRDRRFANRLNMYYDEVIASLRDVRSILLFGPGEAKGELRKRLEHKGLGHRIMDIETVDKMTARQIASKTRKRFLTESLAAGAQ